MPIAPPTRPATPPASSEASGSSTSSAAIASTPSRSLSSSRPWRRPSTSRIDHAASRPSAAPLAPSTTVSLESWMSAYAPPAPARKKISSGAQAPWRRSSSQPNSATEPTTAISYAVCVYANSDVTARHGSSAPGRPYQKFDRSNRPDLIPTVTRTEASTSSHVAHGRRSARMPGISPGLSRGSWGRERLLFGGRGTPPRSSFGARFWTRAPQYGHSVMYGDTSAPQLLQTRERSGPLDMRDLKDTRRDQPADHL